MDVVDSSPALLRFSGAYFENHTTADKCLIRNSMMFLSMCLEIAILITVSHILHMFLKRLGQPNIVSQILVGILAGPTALGKCNIFVQDKTQIDSVAIAARILVMFLVGLEFDISSIKHKTKTVAIICGGNGITCLILTIIVGPLLKLLPCNRLLILFIPTLFLILFNTSSPLLTRLINKLKLTMTEIGRVSVSIAVVNNATCTIMLALLCIFPTDKADVARGGTMMKSLVRVGALFLLLVVPLTMLIRLMVNHVNKKNDYREEVGDDVMCALFLVLFTVTYTVKLAGPDPLMAAFIVGLVIPRNGPTSRTMVGRVTYLVNNFILPVYFADAGMKTDLRMLRDVHVLKIIATVILMGIVGKVGGTMVAAKFLGIQWREGIVLGLLLNVKGHIDLMIITHGSETLLWDERAHMALLITVLFNSIIAGPIVAYVVRRERQAIQYTYKGLEWLSLNSELRMLACVHSPHDVATMLDLIEISSGYCHPDQHSNLVPYIFKLIELTRNLTSHSMLYHQLQDKQDYNNDAGNSQARQISGMVDKFVKDSNINVYELTAISRIETMHEDLQHGIQDVQAALVVLPFHRRRRFDGRLGVGKEDIRKFNENVLLHAPCSVGILVDMGLMDKDNINLASASVSISSDDKPLLRVVVFFLGGPDDREAAGYAGRLALHPCVSVTMVRFFPTFRQGGSRVYAREGLSSSNSGSRLMEAEGSTDHQDQDELFVLNFFNKFVVTDMVTYEERRVDSSTELIRELSSMQGMYSLYILGRHSQGPTASLVEGMGTMSECQELGPIGDLLTSSDFMLYGTILVISQYDVTTAKDS